jgi:hypothetical protein
MSIVDTGRFWEILVIPVLQILENTGNTSIADTQNPHENWTLHDIVFQYCDLVIR